MYDVVLMEVGHVGLAEEAAWVWKLTRHLMVAHCGAIVKAGVAPKSAMVRRIEASLRLWSRQPAAAAADLGRSLDKALQLSETRVALEEAAQTLQASFDPYGSATGPEFETPLVGRHYREAVVACLGRLPASSLNSTRPVVASRLRFWGRPAFDARPLMDPRTRRAFVSPSSLELARALEHRR